jgi:rhodanese-related sulfurtransferase
MQAQGDEPIDSAGAQIAGRVIVVAFVLVAVLAVGYFALRMPGMDMSESSDGKTRMEAMPGMPMGGPQIRTLSVEGFVGKISQPESIVVNVHVPYAGEIGGTDAFIPFDRIAGDVRLPEDKDARLLLYCRTMRMSTLAATTLGDEGFTNVVVLRGGMQAWEASGRTLETRQRG